MCVHAYHGIQVEVRRQPVKELVLSSYGGSKYQTQIVSGLESSTLTTVPSHPSLVSIFKSNLSCCRSHTCSKLYSPSHKAKSYSHFWLQLTIITPLELNTPGLPKIRLIVPFKCSYSTLQCMHLAHQDQATKLKCFQKHRCLILPTYESQALFTCILQHFTKHNK